MADDLPNYINVHGMKVDVVDKPPSDGVVIGCQLKGEPATFDDNMFGTCAKCGADIQFRPYNKDKGRLVCIPCCVAHMVAEAIVKGEVPGIHVNSEGAREVLEYRKRSGN